MARTKAVSGIQSDKLVDATKFAMYEMQRLSGF